MSCPPHRYRIEEPHDGLREQPGRCVRCGAERVFRVSGDEFGWNGEGPPKLQRFEIQRGGVRYG